MRTTVRRSEADRGGEQSVEAGPALAALNDAACRRILSVVGSGAHTVTEIAEACDLPSSTAYRKVDLLTEASLIEERTRIRADGNHVSEYVSDVSAVTLGLSEEGVDVSVDRSRSAN